MDDLDVLVAELHHVSAERDAAIARAERAECINATLQRDRDAVVAEGMRNYDAAVARAEAAEALAASRLDVSPEDAEAYDKFVIAMFDGNAIPMAVWTRAERIRAALRAHAAKVSR